MATAPELLFRWYLMDPRDKAATPISYVLELAIRYLLEHPDEREPPATPMKTERKAARHK